MLSFKRFTVKDFWVDKGENLDGNVAHFGHGILPTVHDECWRVGGEHNLCIGVEFAHKADEVLLPLKVQTGFGLVHKQHIVLLVLGEHGEQNEQYLLFAARQ